MTDYATLFIVAMVAFLIGLIAYFAITIDTSYHLYLYNGKTANNQSFSNINEASNACAMLNGLFQPSQKSNYGNCTGNFAIQAMT